MPAQDLKDVEMTLVDIIKILKNYKRTIIALPIVFGLIALVMQQLQTPAWEAKAEIEIGQVANFSYNGQINAGQALGQLIESPEKIIARITSGPFIVKATQDLKLSPKDQEASLALFKSSVKAIPISNTNLIRVSAEGSSKEVVKSFLLSLIELLKSQQVELTKPGHSNLRLQLKHTDENLNAINEETKSLLKLLNTTQDKAIIAGLLLPIKNKEKREAEERKLLLEEQLSIAANYPTKLLNEVSVNSSQSGNTKLVIFLAILIGLFVAVVSAFIHNSLKDNLFSNNS